ncbi:MAG TPA: hypothetical protein VEJ20_09275, partial [Candidatus Eremiobacteraceae bacterium]|nr:hypothetical protein [Candidatus Eremiobacteraceae bacterium]
MAAVIAACIAAAACGNAGQGSFGPAPVVPEGATVDRMPPAEHPLPSNVRRSCAAPAPPGYARCFALVRTDVATL